MSKFRPFAGLFAVVMVFAFTTICHSAEKPAAPDQAQHLGRLGPGDSVSVRVYGQPDADTAYVADDGTINVPLVGDIPVNGLTPVEAAARVAKTLKDGGFFIDPHVTIVITDSRSQLVSVIGEVKNVGHYPVGPRTTIIDLLTLAGGLKETASDVGYVARTDADGHTNRYPIKLNGLADIKDALPTAALLGGDSLIIPRAENCFVLGEVTTPGKVPVEAGMSVIQAIARAGGVNERGSERRIQLKRLDKDGTYHEVHVKPNDPVQAGDMIRVKESIF